MKERRKQEHGRKNANIKMQAKGCDTMKKMADLTYPKKIGKAVEKLLKKNGIPYRVVKARKTFSFIVWEEDAKRI